MAFAPSVLAALEELHRRGLPLSQLRPALPELEQFPVPIQLEILAKLGEVDPTSIANKAGFLRGIMNRYRLRPPLPVPDSSAQMGPLCEEAHQMLQANVESGHFTEEDLCHSVFQVIAAQGPATQIEILQKFAMADLGAVKQKVRFLEGIVRRCTTPPTAITTPSGLSDLTLARLDQLSHDGRLKPGDLQGSVLAALAALPPEMQCRTLDRFQEVNLDAVGNKSAFLNGIVKRLAKRRARPSAVPGPPDPSAETPVGSSGAPNPTFPAALDQLFTKGRLSRDEFDYELCAEFSDFPEPLAVEILERYGEADLESVPNHRTFLQTLIHDYRHLRSPERSGAVTDMSAPAYYHPLPAGALPHSVLLKLQELLGVGVILGSDITPVWYQELSVLHAEEAVEILSRFQGADLRAIECKTTFLLRAIQEAKHMHPRRPLRPQLHQQSYLEEGCWLP